MQRARGRASRSGSRVGASSAPYAHRRRQAAERALMASNPTQRQVPQPLHASFERGQSRLPREPWTSDDVPRAQPTASATLSTPVALGRIAGAVAGGADNAAVLQE